ncbi:hypothetical protein L1049_012931 [Liquidambar formosana]|uniref:Cation/H+ exchanger domain-containing protein n=1 Tax=Liquidambar formosana TaxID=63359 RepID=A0AAP0RL77_LIQFO
MVMGFLTDMFGIAIGNGPLWLGLVIPDGPPLGATLVERSETIMTEILMPFSFTLVGLYTDVFTLSAGWSGIWPLLLMAFAAFVAKFVATLVTSLYFKMPFRESLTLSLIMSLRGQVELVLFIHWIDKKMIKKASFTTLVLLTTLVTAVCTPLISILYDPTRPYMTNKKRTIQHTPANTEFHIEHYLGHSSRNTIHNALKIYEETKENLVKIHLYTTVSPRRSMYQDICELALVNKATLIILPFHKESLDSHRNGGTQTVRQRMQSVNSNVLAHAPCSVGILVEKSPLQGQLVLRSFRRPRSTHHFAMLFLGGADSREALVYADRMAENPDVHLSVIRFLSHNYEGDDEMEKKLDDGLVTWFWVKNETNDQVAYREVVVRNGEETVAAIHAMNDLSYDLWIVGRKQGINPMLLEGLSDWSENHELGIIGDYIASMDFCGVASVLVIQQQVLRGQGVANRVHAYDRLSTICYE